MAGKSSLLSFLFYSNNICIHQVYNCTKLTLVLVGPPMKDLIRSLATKKDMTFSAVGPDIIACKRAHVVGTYLAPEASTLGRPPGPVVSLLLLSDQLLSLTSNGFLFNWSLAGDYSAQPMVMDLLDEGRGSSFGRPSCIAHPDTYLNKVLIGGDLGRVQLWNFMTGQLIHTFDGWGAGVRTLAPSPALDVVAAGESNDKIHSYRKE